MRKLLRLVVEHGTGKLANAPGYLVGGKTGTAEKVSGPALCPARAVVVLRRRLSRSTTRAIVVLISIDEPHGNKQSLGFATGGWVAAPAVKATDRAHGLDRGNPTGGRGFARNSPFSDGRLASPARGGNLRLTELMDGDSAFVFAYLGRRSGDRRPHLGFARG